MNDTHEQMLDDVAVYALGTLPAADAARVREHLQTCAQCREEYAALAPAAAAIGLSAEAQPGDLLKARIMQAVRPPAPRAAVSGWKRFGSPAYLVAAACLAFAVAIGAINLSLIGQLHDSKATIAELEMRAGGYAHVLSEQESELADLSSDKAKRYEVKNGQIVRVGDRLYLAMHDLPEPPTGKVYQAWTLPKGGKTMVPAPTFVPDSHGGAIVQLPVNARTTAVVAISIEPEGGSAAPTSKPLVVQALD
jgi:anti-sigma-K factor RskA